MIDMTFNLIAFFMVLINFSQSEQNDKVVLPTSELAKPVDAPIEFPIIVHLTNDGTVVIGGDELSVEG
jgi:biopolymer transport protein ExbD